MLLKYRPELSEDSKLLNDFQISNLTEHMHYCRGMQWILLYRLSEHGVSLNTFLKRLTGYETTLIVMEDKVGWKFGALAFEEWQSRKEFYGTGESFVFTFEKGDEVQMWPATGENSMY